MAAESPTIEIDDGDIVCVEPADGQRAHTRLRYRRVNDFLGHYLQKIRQGKGIIIEAPPGASAGDVIDVEIAVSDIEPFLLHAEVVGLLLGQAKVRFIAGRMTDRIVAPLAERALGKRLAHALLDLTA
jgi:hypothetical protein